MGLLWSLDTWCIFREGFISLLLKAQALCFPGITLNTSFSFLGHMDIVNSGKPQWKPEYCVYGWTLWREFCDSRPSQDQYMQVSWQFSMLESSPWFTGVSSFRGKDFWSNSLLSWVGLQLALQCPVYITLYATSCRPPEIILGQTAAGPLVAHLSRFLPSVGFEQGLFRLASSSRYFGVLYILAFYCCRFMKGSGSWGKCILVLRMETWTFF